MFQIKHSGVSSAFLTGNKNNCFIELNDEEIVLIDIAGENFAAMRDSGILNSRKHIHVVITHTHGDHVSGIGCLGLYSFYSIQPALTKKMTVYAPSAIYADVCDIIRIFGTTYVHYHGVKEIKDEVIIGNLAFRPIEVPHAPELKSFAYLIGDGETKVYYSGDSNTLPEGVLEAFLKGSVEHLFVDVCIADYPGNVHCHYSIVKNAIPKNMRSRVTLMHFDKNFPYETAVNDGFRLAEICDEMR